MAGVRGGPAWGSLAAPVLRNGAANFPCANPPAVVTVIESPARKLPATVDYMLRGTREGSVTFLHADLRAPERILSEAAKKLDFGQPVAVLLHGVLHSVPDADDPSGILRKLVAAVPGGSYLSLCQLTADQYPERAEFARVVNQQQIDSGVWLRDRARVTSFFDGLDLVEPGVVQLSKWRPDMEEESQAPVPLWGGLARKPEGS